MGDSYVQRTKRRLQYGKERQCREFSAVVTTKEVNKEKEKPQSLFPFLSFLSLPSPSYYPPPPYRRRPSFTVDEPRQGSLSFSPFSLQISLHPSLISLLSWTRPPSQSPLPQVFHHTQLYKFFHQVQKMTIWSTASARRFIWRLKALLESRTQVFSLQLGASIQGR